MTIRFRTVLAPLLFLCLAGSFSLQAQTISTVAGGSRGDGGPAIAAPIYTPFNVALDGAGNLYVVDLMHYCIRKITPNGIVTTVAGNGGQGFNGDGGPATQAGMKPMGLTVDSAGNLYIADGNGRIRKVDTKGIITTVAGSGGAFFSGDGGFATLAKLAAPSSVALDSAGNLYIADSANHRVRRVGTNGFIQTIAGDGVARLAGDGSAATSASLNFPSGLAFDAAGNLYIADASNNRIRKIGTDGIITTVTGAANELRFPTSVALDSGGNLYVADSSNSRILRMTPSGSMMAIAGTGFPNFSGDGGAATQATLRFAHGVAIDGAGNLFIADAGNHRVRKVDQSGVITTVAGIGTAGYGNGGQATAAALQNPQGVAIDASGNLYVADALNRQVRKVSSGGVITTVAGNGTEGFSGDGGPANAAALGFSGRIAVDGTGNLFIADSGNHRVRKVTPNGIITTVAGTGEAGVIAGDNGDGGQATAAKVWAPLDIALDRNGNLYIAELNSGRIRKVTPAGIIGTVTTNSLAAYIAVDSAGSLYFSQGTQIHKIDAAGLRSTVAGTVDFGFSGDGGPALAARLGDVRGLALDSAGNLYIADSSFQRIRKVSGGIISTIAGTGSVGFRGDGGVAASASFAIPSGLAVDAAGNIYVADEQNHRIRKISSIVNAPANYQGAWLGGPAENGWGLSLIQHGATLAAGWYYFDAEGRATWTIMPGCSWNAGYTSCTGNLYNSIGAAFTDYNAEHFAQEHVGTMTFAFTSVDSGTMSYNVRGVSGQKAIKRFNFATGNALTSADYTDIWGGGAAQNGWGVVLIQQEAEVVGAWYTYDAQNRPTWFLLNNSSWLDATTFGMRLTRATGSPMIGTVYDAAMFKTSIAGAASFTVGPGSGSMAFTVDGVFQVTRPFMRLPF